MTMTKGVTVIILAAGLGSRLRPYTDDRPKCMVSIESKPIIERQLTVSYTHLRAHET